MANDQLNARIPADMMAEIEEMREERNLSKAEAARRLLDRGLQQINSEGSAGEKSDAEKLLDNSVERAEQSIQISAAFAVIAAAFTYIPAMPTAVALVFLVPTVLGLVVSFTRLQTAYAVLRQQGYGHVEMARIALSAHTTDVSSVTRAEA